MLLLMKAKLALVACALAVPMLATALAPAPSHEPDGTRRLASASFRYRAAGDFSRAGRPIQEPLREARLPSDLYVMKRQVTVGEYGRCVDDGACPRVPVAKASQAVPITGVSWHDASAYAIWITRRTGIVHRLPTDEEWIFAAAEKAREEALPLVDPADPAQAWIGRYEAEASRERPSATAPQPGGTFGTNSKGLDDLAGNVWEWTDTCFVRYSLDDGGERATNINCGVRVVEGAHRSYMTDFIRDPKSGGCAAGTPPTNLGFRLVVEPPQPTLAGLVRSATVRLRRS